MAAKIWPHAIKAIIFDNDGTLVDTEWVYSWAHEKITGEKLSWDLKPQLMGKPAKETCELLIQRYNLKMPLDELMAYRTKIVEECWDKVKLLPGAKEITDKFARWRLRHRRGEPCSSRRCKRTRRTSCARYTTLFLGAT